MPLSEFLRMAGRKIESRQPPCPSDHFSRSENDLLVWENGPVTIQGQSTRVTRNPSLSTNRVGDARNKMTGGVESVLNDMFPVVTSGDVDLSQDDETSPWLDALAQDYASVLLPEISGVVSNGMSTHNSFVSGVSNLHSGGFSPKASSPLKARLLSSWPPPQHLQTSEALGSLVLDYIGKNTSNHSRGDDVFANPPTINSSNYVNFSHFARPAILIKAEVPDSNEILISGVERVDVKEKGSDASGINPVASSGQPVDKTAKDSCPPEITENLGQETLVKNDKPLIVINGTDSTEGVLYGEKSIDPIVATSSVGSGNSADRFSCERALNSKRKSRDTEESECRSDDVETNSVGEEKPTLGPGSGSKRSRAAEVHNLSERRRRDRINEKMRALQELIPNCNKTDKASMLDEAIEYLKTLQLQVQIMSMGAGLCMPPVIFPPGVQHMHPAHIPHFTSMGPVRMGMRFGMGMLDMNGGPPVFPVPPLQAPQFSASIPANFHTTTGPNLLVYGHPGHRLPNSIPMPSSFPLSRQPPVNSAMGLSGLRSGSQNAVLPSSCLLSGQSPVNSAVGLSGLRNRSQNAVSSTLPVLNTGDITNIDKQVSCNAIGGSSINQKSDQLHATDEVLHQSATVQEDKQPTDASGAATLTFITTTH